MSHIQLIIAVLGFATQLVKWLGKREDSSTKAKVAAVKNLKATMKYANETGEQSYLDDLINDLRKS